MASETSKRASHLKPAPDRTLVFSDAFVLSGGTVTIDRSKNLVLLIHNRKNGHFLLPKGRKDIGESIEAAAVRETLEESGYKCHLIPHGLVTEAPSPAAQATPTSPPEPQGNEQQQGRKRLLRQHMEPIAVQQRRDRWGTHKVIFWYLAEADSSDVATTGMQESWEDFEPRWVPMDEAAGMMSFEDDGLIVARALEAVSTIDGRN